MKRFKILSLVVLLMVGVVCFGGCDLFNRDNTFEVLSNSMYPTLKVGDKVVVEERDNYVVGDIVVFNTAVPTVVHRIIGITTEGETTYYICHGDNVQSANPNSETLIAAWQDDANYIQGLIDNDKTIEQIRDEALNVQIITYNQIEGVVVRVIKK